MRMFCNRDLDARFPLQPKMSADGLDRDPRHGTVKSL